MLGEHFLKQFPITVAVYISYTPKYTPVTPDNRVLPG